MLGLIEPDLCINFLMCAADDLRSLQNQHASHFKNGRKRKREGDFYKRVKEKTNNFLFQLNASEQLYLLDLFKHSNYGTHNLSTTYAN